MKKLVIFTILILSAFFVFDNVFKAFAEDICSDVEDCQEQIEKYTKKIEEKQNKAASLSGEIEYMDNQINLTQLRIQNSIAKIASTEKEIAKLASNIEDIKERLGKLDVSIEYQKKVLEARMRSRYKIQESSPVIVFFGSSTVEQLIHKAEYLHIMELQDNKMLDEMAKSKTAYNKQQDIFEDKKTESETLKANLEAEKRNLDVFKGQLDGQKNEKKRLLEITQNDEQKYQDLLQDARDQLDSFSNFTSSAGGGVVGSGEFGDGDEGWYLSQRDSDWANKKIGESDEKIIDVGCLVTSVAMVYRKYGSDVDPADIAKDTSRYFSDTAMMLIPWKGPSGKKYTSISTSQIDSELSSGRPVIVGIYAGPYGTHFVVLAKKSGSDYIMYDPWYGPDLKFSSKYSKGSIFQAVVFK